MRTIAGADRVAHAFHPSILREYDVRGLFGRTLHAADGYAVGRSFGTRIVRAGGSRVVVGRDGRRSSPGLEAALLRGLTDSGVHVLRIGLGPSPMLYFAEATLEVDGGVQITGSHNPGDHNGFKLVQGQAALFGEDIRALGAMAASGDWDTGAGQVEDVHMLDDYVARLVRDFDGSAYRIGWDAGNGAAGPVVEKLVKLLPGEHHLLFTDVDGDFPNHHPDPVEEANLAHLRALVLDKKLDFGVAFDGDGDRIGVIDGRGRVIGTDQLLAMLAAPILAERPGATIIADVKASRTLFERIAALGGRPLMWKTGHSLIKSKMKQTGSPLAGETGHIYIADRYYGFDDALYAAVRLIGAATRGGGITALRDAMPTLACTPELRFPVDAARKFALVDAVRDRVLALGTDVDLTDGVRVETADGWWLLRASNTQEMLVARAEAMTESKLIFMLAELDGHLAHFGVVRG
jgi:phosphomannomutase